jgi:ketosteroid isomerase-like protein
MNGGAVTHDYRDYLPADLCPIDYASPDHCTRLQKTTMRPLLVALLIMLAPAVATAQHEHRAAPADTAEVRATIVALFDAAERGDFEALGAIYSGEDLTVIEGAGIDRGWTEYRDHHLAPELEAFQNFEYRPSQIEAHVAGDFAWAIFRYSLRADYQERRLDHVGRGTAVLERRDDRWVVRHTQTSSRPRRDTDPADW